MTATCRHCASQMSEQIFIVQIHLSQEQLLAMYQGQVQRVWLRAQDGRTLSLPLVNLRPYVSWQGISGRFAITIDAQAKLQRIERLA